MTRRSKRYGKLVRGWDWRTTPDRLEQMEIKRLELDMSKTQFLEWCIDKQLEGMMKAAVAVSENNGIYEIKGKPFPFSHIANSSTLETIKPIEDLKGWGKWKQVIRVHDYTYGGWYFVD